MTLTFKITQETTVDKITLWVNGKWVTIKATHDDRGLLISAVSSQSLKAELQNKNTIVIR
jgi:hypothetical protein